MFRYLFKLMHVKYKDVLSEHKTECSIFMQRVFFAYIVIILSIIVIIINLYNLQIRDFTNYSMQSKNNCIKIIPISPSRGIIYDRNGHILALNKIVYKLEINSENIQEFKNTIKNLQPILNLTNEDVLTFERIDKRINCNKVLPLNIELTEIQLARFLVNKFKFSDINIKSHQQRYYPYGSTLTHVLGYVSKINKQDKESLINKGIFNNYMATDNIGKLGIERYYEEVLHGKIGYGTVEVNSRGQIIRILNKQLPESGKNVFLTLDLKLQQYVKKLLLNDRASVIVLDPRDGGILALVSNPSYNPNLFVEGISNQDFNNLLKNKNFPLLNRTIQATYPPASTVKPYILISALTLGIINQNFSIFDPGWWQLPGSQTFYRDWKRCGHGYLNIINAIEESADTFFYQLAYNMGIDNLAEWMNKFGYGQYTGVDLLEECSGIMPNPSWKKQRFNKPWYQGDTISVGIGQGYWTATPMQMSKALLTLINNGFVKIPHLLNFVSKDDFLLYYVPKYKQIGDPESKFWNIVKHGMFGAVHSPNGTVRNSFINSSYKVAAKSGTAQVYSLKKDENYNAISIPIHLRDHKLITAFAPYDNPTIAVVVVLENGGNNQQSVGLIARKIFDFVLLNSVNKDNSSLIY